MTNSLDVGVPWIMCQQDDAPQPMYHGRTNFDRTAGGPFITTTYDYNAPLDEFGNLNQPKYGHLKQLHDVFHAMEKTLTYGNISTADFGNLVMTTVNQTEEGSSCFIGNVNAKINFQGTSYDVPAWYVSILPYCKTESYNTAKVLSNDESDFLWYMTTVNLKEQDPAWEKNMSLRINSTAHVLHGFVNGQHTDNYRVENGKFHYVFEQDAKFNPGVNVITLLSVTVDLPNYGAFFENVPAGITGPVFIIGRNGDETVVKYLSTHNGATKLTIFKAPLGSEPVGVDLLGFGKGTASINENNTGRYWPDPPVLLRFSTHLLHNRVLASSPYRYVMSELISQYAKNLAIILKHLSNITLARTRVQALSRVVLFGPVRFTTLTTFTTPLGLLTMAICSSIDSSLEELSIIFDLTCTKMLYSFWLKALKELLSIKSIDPFIYLFIYLMLALWNAPYGCIVNFGISDSLLL
ncbi:putative beta-galactosidase [Arabidopsis thaliana]